MQNAFRDFYIFPTDISWYKSITQLEIKVSRTYDKGDTHDGGQSSSCRRTHLRHRRKSGLLLRQSAFQQTFARQEGALRFQQVRSR
mgnify:CR=1 FL=1